MSDLLLGCLNLPAELLPQLVGLLTARAHHRCRVLAPSPLRRAPPLRDTDRLASGGAREPPRRYQRRVERARERATTTINPTTINNQRPQSVSQAVKQLRPAVLPSSSLEYRSVAVLPSCILVPPSHGRQATSLEPRASVAGQKFTIGGQLFFVSLSSK